MEAKIGCAAPRQGMPGATRAIRGEEEFFTESLEGLFPTTTLISLILQTPKLREETSVVLNLDFG